MKLSGKVAVITGASRGIGSAIADVLNKEGVTCYDISRTVKEQVFIKKAYQADVNNGERIDEILNDIFDKEGKIDIFINNAGFGIGGLVEFAKQENIYKQIETNLSAVVANSSKAIKYLKKTKGRLINISSVGAVIPLPYQATYSATKAGVEIFSKALGNEVKEYGIKVTSILPGDTKTGFTAARVIDTNGASENQIKNSNLSIAKIEKDETKGMSPYKVAKVVRGVLKRKHPPLRKTVGFVYKIIVILPRLLPAKFVNFVVGKLYCKKAKEEKQ